MTTFSCQKGNGRLARTLPGAGSPPLAPALIQMAPDRATWCGCGAGKRRARRRRRVPRILERVHSAGGDRYRCADRLEWQRANMLACRSRASSRRRSRCAVSSLDARCPTAGLGYYRRASRRRRSSRSRRRRRPRFRSQLALAWEQVASNLFVLHIRHATWGALSDANTQPFARTWGRRDWVIAHAGSSIASPRRARGCSSRSARPTPR